MLLILVLFELSLQLRLKIRKNRFLNFRIQFNLNLIKHALIADNFIKSVQGKVTPGTSALFLLGEVTARDRVIDSLKEAGLEPELIASNMSTEQEAALRDAFGEEA